MFPGAALSSSGGSLSGGYADFGGYGLGSIYAQTAVWTENSADPPSQTVATQQVGSVAMSLSDIKPP